jgi:hypothetical protein
MHMRESMEGVTTRVAREMRVRNAVSYDGGRARERSTCTATPCHDR